MQLFVVYFTKDDDTSVSSFVRSGNFCFEVPIYIKSGPGEELEPSLFLFLNSGLKVGHNAFCGGRSFGGHSQKSAIFF